MNQREILNFNAQITPVKPLNDEMTLCKCYVLALGKNRNYSHISREAVEAALPTIYNIPVIGHMYVDDNGEYHMGGHDMTLARDEDGQLKFQSLCVPFGTVPNPNNIHYEEIVDSNGNKNTYQVADVILWTGRYPDLYKAIYDDDIYFGQSMEIDVKAYEPLNDDRRYTDIKSFSYSALCLLGKSDDKEFHVEPCFPESRVEPYQFALDNSKFKELMKEFKAELSECFQAIETKKGGDKRLTIEVCNSVLAEFGLSNEDLDFEVTEEMTEEELKNKLSKIKAPSDEEQVEAPAEEPVKETEEVESEESEVVNDETNSEQFELLDNENDQETPVETQEETFETRESLTYQQIWEALSIALDSKSTHDEGQDVYYLLNDCDDEFVYFTEVRYTESAIDKSNYRAHYVVNDGKAVLSGEFEKVVLKWLTKEEVAELENQKAEYEELKSFREERLEDDRIKEYDAVLSEFSDLTINEEYLKVVEDKMSFATAEALREKCYAIRGKTLVVSATKKPEMKIPVEFSQTPAEPYGGFFSKYPPKVKRGK